MKSSLSLFVLLLLACVLLAGCQVYSSPPEAPRVVISLATETSEPQKSVTATITPGFQQVENPLPTELMDSGEINSLECEDLFCQLKWDGYLERPIGLDHRQEIDLTYPYASTKDGALDPHHGVEFPNPFGTPVLAAAAGEVVYAGSDAQTLLGPYQHFYGNVIILKHPGLFLDQDVFTLYAHLSSIKVEVGEAIAQGQMLGEVGASGAADGSHLHFEVRLGSNAYDCTVNPVLWFTPIHPPGSPMSATLSGVILDRTGQVRSEVGFVLERFDDQGAVAERYYPETYHAAGANSHPVFGENFAVPDIPAGDYRLSYVSGGLYEEFFTLEPGSVGFFTLREK